MGPNTPASNSRAPLLACSILVINRAQRTLRIGC
jgi:hypothetical protein